MSGHFGVSGFSALAMTQDNELFWGGDESRIQILRKPAVVSSAAVDAGMTPTSVLRKGLILGRITASDNHVQWDPAATDGSQDLDGVLPVELRMFDSMNTAVKRNPPIIVSAPLRASSLLILGAAFVGHAHEFLARRSLARLGCVLDDDTNNYRSGYNQRVSTVVADRVVVAADNGTLFLANTANVTFTLPAIRAGLSYEFLRVSDHNLVVASAEGDNVIVGNDMQADSITFSTAGNRIGARVRVTGILVAGALRWLAEVIPAPFSTGAFLTQTLAT